MATFNKFNSFVEHLAEGNLDLDSDNVYVCLTNSAPSASNTVYTDITDLSTAYGYTAGGNKASLSTSAQTSGTYKLVLADPATWTASGGSIGPFRYAVAYLNTGSKYLIGWWDYGSSITLSAGETFTVDFDATNGVIQIS